MPIKTLKRRKKVNRKPGTSLTRMESSSKEVHKEEKLVSIETSNGQQVFFPITYTKAERNKIINKIATQGPGLFNNVTVKQSETPIARNSIIIEQRRQRITDSSVMLYPKLKQLLYAET